MRSFGAGRSGRISLFACGRDGQDFRTAEHGRTHSTGQPAHSGEPKVKWRARSCSYEATAGREGGRDARVITDPGGTPSRHTPGAPRRGAGAARWRSGAGRGAHRAAPGARGRRKRSETAQVPLGETVQGDPGDPPDRSKTPNGQPQQPLGGAGWSDWPSGTSRGRHAAKKAYIRWNLVR